MKIKSEEKIVPRALAIHDLVLTPISQRKGRIVKIEELPINYIMGYYEGMPTTYKEYTVEIKFPYLQSEQFKTLTTTFMGHELNRHV